MKPSCDNNGTAINSVMLEGPRPCTILCFNVYITVEYLNRNFCIGQLFQ